MSKVKVFGIDVSKWQGNFNFNKAKSEGAEFAVLKAGGGDVGLYKDIKFEQNYTNAKSAGLSVGAYWYSKALTIDAAVKEADYFASILKGKQFELPVYMDVEDAPMLALGKKPLTSIVKAFCGRMEELGYWVGIYSSNSYFTSKMDDNELQRYSHWVAQWTKSCTYAYKDTLGMWQFGGETNPIRTNKVAGVTCDQNYMLIDYPTLIKSKKLNGYQESKVETPAVSTPTTSKKSVEEIAKEVIQGKWGNGITRKQKLNAAGYNYDAVQAKVEKLLKSSTSTNNTKTTFVNGTKVKLTSDAVIYGTKKKFAPFVYKSVLYVVGNPKTSRVVVSTKLNGQATGAVDKKYLVKS